jgi:CheY-like chemotaxis protein
LATQSTGASRIASELGRGTTTELWLPRAPAGAAAKSPSPTDEAQRGPERALRILLVDDHAEVRSTTAAMLHDCGHEVIESASGSAALASLKAGDCDYDLMISDYAMPHLSGTDFLRQAREVCPGVPALIITGYAEADAISDRPEDVEVLLKPFTASKLQALVARACSDRVAQ